jgi:hypothetical protein
MRVGLSLGVLARAHRTLFPTALGHRTLFPTELGHKTVSYWLPVSGADRILVCILIMCETPDKFLVFFPPACRLAVQGQPSFGGGGHCLLWQFGRPAKCLFGSKFRI